MSVTPFPKPIPAPFDELVERIDHEVSWLHLVWRIYRQLFAEADTVKVLNKSAPAAARIIQNAVLDDTYLSISRLLDPPSSGKTRHNLVVEQLRPLVDLIGDSSVTSAFDKALTDLKAASDAIRKQRDKRIAHADLGVALEKVTLPGVSRAVVETALSHLRDSMNAIHRHFSFGDMLYDHVGASGGGDALIGMLRDGLRLREVRRQSHRGMSESELRAAVQHRPPYPDAASETRTD